MHLTIHTRPWVRWLVHPAARVLWAALLVAFLAAGAIFIIHYYNVYAAIIDARLSSPIFSQTSVLYAAPVTVTAGEAITPAALGVQLRRAGYAEDRPAPVGTFTQTDEAVSIRPGPDAYYSPAPADIEFDNGVVDTITNPSNQASLSSYDLEPEYFTTLFDQKREKRRLVHYQDLPPTLVRAVLDIEDRDFFNHGAIDYWRIPTAVFRDLRSGKREQGASTITMQVARNIFLTLDRTWQRKFTETLIAIQLEQRLTKQQIFELYANQISLGSHGSYHIQGFGEAANAFFGKDIKNLNLQECALLAGIIHGPNLDSPFRHPDRARRRRDQVLAAMRANGDISETQREQAAAAPFVLSAANDEASDAPYFADLVRDRLGEKFSQDDLTSQSYRIYTTLDPDLQNAAARAVADKITDVDKELADLRAQAGASRPRGRAPQQVQVALIAIDPHTGAVKALVGGRNYGVSQLDHALAERPTGSIFKPFVYATALETGLLPNLSPITQTSMLMDEPTTFEGGYAPINFEKKYFGAVTLRTALEHSLNNATISLAEEVGLPAVTDLAHAAGIVNAQPTPSEAIGTYTATPLEMAEAYTIFANAGVRVTPRLVYSVQSSDGQSIYRDDEKQTPVLDPRIAFLTTNLLESVLDNGTAVRVRTDGFTAPAAGKTGTSHDAWFAGYTSNLLCVVWVGLDNYQDIKIEGAHAALPIWTEFMKRAVALPAYQDTRPFAAPPGVVAVRIDTETRQLATPLCPASQVETEYYLQGTEPRQTCRLHPTNLTPRGLIAGALSLFHLAPTPAAPVAAPPPGAAPGAMPGAAVPVSPANAANTAPGPAAAAPPPAKKKGLFGKIFGALKGGGGG